MRLRLHAPYFSTYVFQPSYLCPHTSSTYPICVAPLSKKNRRLDYRPLSGKMNPPHIIRDSLSWGGSKIELGRAVEIVLKGIAASGGSRNIL